MKELKIYKFQAEEIEDALRMVSYIFESHKKETCVDRSIILSLKLIRNVLDETIDNRVTRDNF